MTRLKERVGDDVHQAQPKSSPFSEAREFVSGLMERIPDLSGIRNNLTLLLAPATALALSGCGGTLCINTIEKCKEIAEEQAEADTDDENASTGGTNGDEGADETGDDFDPIAMELCNDEGLTLGVNCYVQAIDSITLEGIGNYDHSPMFPDQYTTDAINYFGGQWLRDAEGWNVAENHLEYDFSSNISDKHDTIDTVKILLPVQDEMGCSTIDLFLNRSLPLMPMGADKAPLDHVNLGDTVINNVRHRVAEFAFHNTTSKGMIFGGKMFTDCDVYVYTSSNGASTLLDIDKHNVENPNENWRGYLGGAVVSMDKLP